MKICLEKSVHYKLPIRRHIKIRAEANTYNPEYADYFLQHERIKRKMRISDQEFLNSKLKSHQTIQNRTAGSFYGL